MNSVTRLDPPRPPRVLNGTLIVDEDGDWAISTDGDAPDGYLIRDEDGDLAADATAVSGQRIARLATDILTY